MTTRTTVRSWPAMALAAVFLAGTSFVLFQDLLDGARLTTGHVLTALALIAATAAGHQIISMFRARRLGVALGMVLLTAAALSYVAVMSGARNAEQLAQKAERIDGSNAVRAEIVAERKKAQAMLDQARADIAKECASGEGSRCRGRRATEAVYSAAAAGHDARLAALAPPATPNAGYKAAAEAIALTGLTSRSQDELERALIVLLPWLAVLISELGTIVFLSSALGHQSHPVPAPEPRETEVEPDPEPGHRAEVISWVREFRRRHGRNPQIPELQARFRCPKTTAWRRIKAA